MDKLLEFVIKHGDVNLVALYDMLLCLEPSEAERFVLAVFGIDEYHLPDDFPMQVEDKGIIKTFKEYNYLKDRVECTYERQASRWYKDEESAKKNAWDYKGSKCEGFEYESVRTETRYDSFSLQGWMNLANSQKNN